jgi:8-amino-7-oxononanoate synthase
MKLPQRHIDQLEKRKKNNSLRTLKVIENLIDFSSNDYLGLAKSKDLINLIHQESNGLSNGSTGSRLLSGNNQLAIDTEQYLVEKLNAPSCLILNSGYTANLAVLSSVPQRGDTIIYDELSHASIKDGMRLSLASKLSFKHNDLDDLSKKLKSIKSGDKFVVVESIYSMNGDRCSLSEIVKMCKDYKAYLILDEAHATGLFGENGGGLSEIESLQSEIFCRIYTFGKAMGIHGAAVVGSDLLIQYLVNFARAFIYTTALPDHSYISIKYAFEYLSVNKDLQKKSEDITAHFISEYDNKLKNKIQRTLSNHPIQTILTPGNDKAKNLSNYLNSNGFDIRAILSPTVKEGQERLRICLHTYNTRDEVSSLIDTLAKNL